MNMKKMKRFVFGLLGILLLSSGMGKADVMAAGKSKIPDMSTVRKAYYRFVKKGTYKKYTNNKRCQGFGVSSENKYGGMIDLDKDQIPELILVRKDKYSSPRIYYIFTWKKGKVCFLKEMRADIKKGDLNLEYHRKKPYIYTQSDNLIMALMDLVDALEEDDTDKFFAKFENGLEGIGFSVASKLYKIIDSNMTLQIKKSITLDVVGTKDGIVLKKNGKHWMEIALSMNGESLFKCEFDNPKFRYGKLSCKIWQEGKSDVELQIDFGGRTAKQIEKLTDTKSDKEIEKLFKLGYYSNGKKISEKKADQILESYGELDLDLDRATNYHKNYRSVEIVSNKKKNWDQYIGIAPDRIKLSYTWIRLRVGQESKIKIRVYPSKASKACTIKSSNPKVADVYDNEIIAFKRGKAVITVRSRLNKNVKKKIRVTVL